MGVEDELRAEIAALKTQVAELQRRTVGDIRLGPRPDTQEDIDRRTERLVKVIETASVAKVPPPVDRSNLCTTSGEPVDVVRANQKEETGQHKGYIVLCDAERAKGFVRPYRDRYQHVGHLIERCEATHQEPTDENPHQCIRPYPHDGDHEFTALMILNKPIRFMPGRKGGCGSVTTMGRALSETWARDIHFYSHTFCVSCNKHFTIAEFVWNGTNEVLGT